MLHLIHPSFILTDCCETNKATSHESHVTPMSFRITPSIDTAHMRDSDHNKILFHMSEVFWER